MARSRNLVLLLALAAAPASADIAPAAPADLLVAVRACVAATGAEGVDGAALESAGFQRGTASADGRQIDTPVQFYGRTGSGVIVMIAPAGGAAQGVCLATARVAAVADRAAMVGALSEAYGRPIQANAEGVVWRADGDIVQLAPTGTDAAPAVRVGVVHVRGEN